ncbi:DUF3127 domain-containing protein [Elizabethkingia sp. HX WHF]|uniref:DUF3127 domain-containing protein n=1 Tax=Elizabethkingia sp. HX WHF TaxID=3003190 RepID=UPI002A2439AE|nr:DUF3127 domain-containing protein [Elizabethkingia sp. HX WHF]MDX8564705.1 DUF3127 domain-containing protein [Elizabethkingia sp. HX WHF]
MSKQVGTLVQKSDLKEFDGGFRVQEFYLDCKRYNQDDGTEYPNMLKFQVVGDKISLLEQFQRGDKIQVDYSPKGRVYQKDDGTTGHVQNLNVFKIERVGFSQPVPAANQYNANQNNNVFGNGDDDDLPF